ncbi:uncharacterized protein LOC104431504 [Eucalyptus grandis]|uniref:uncharacterized protein LOC104431504 n=1 Tax=Eucalyptus grandis TaxID=71139 RepID=UPI00192EFAA6|nr:uncharacterized protein LOC104431504 [Eucalyptus grandis]
MASQKEAFTAKWTAKWTKPLTSLYVSLLVEEVKKGNRTSSAFNKAGWNNIRTEFNKRARLQYTQVQLKNKVNKLKKQYSSFKKLISQSGFGWDNVNKIVVVDDPSIWEPHVKDNIEWAKFKKDGFPQYSDLCIVFGDTYATGEHTTGNAEDLVMLDELGIGGGDADDGREDLSEHYIDVGVFMSDKIPTSVHDKDRMDKTPNSKRRRRSHSFGVANTCKIIREMIKTRTSQSVSGSINSQVTSPPVDPFSVFAVIDVLVAMPTLEQDLYNKAVEQACVSATWREAFIKSPIERRYGLLQSS